MRATRSDTRIYLPLAVMAVLVCAVSAGSLWLGARSIDGVERRREEGEIAKDLARRPAEIEERINAFAVWDEALAHLDGRVDRSWAAANLDQSLLRGPGFDGLLVLDHRDALAYAAGPKPGGPPAAVLLAAAAPLLAPLRGDEARLRPGARVANVWRGRITTLAGQPELVMANLVQSDIARKRPRFGRAPVLVTSSPLDRSLVRPLAERYGVPDLRAELGGAAARPATAAVAMGRSDDGRVVRLRWTPRTPGMALLRSAAPTLLLAAAGLMTLVCLLAERARSMAGQLVRSEDEARRRALHDPLTGLANRSLFADRLAHARERARRRPATLAVLFLDLDGFKEVNDTYGHDAGDELLVEVARRLRGVCRAEDTTARFGGDEFAVLQANSGAEGASALSERIISALTGPVELADGEAQLSCSVGVALVPDPEADPAEALRQADVALYRAKAAGKGRACFFEPEMDAAARRRRELERDLREALARDGLHNLYQVVVDGEGRPVGAEALARWTRADGASVPPSVFVPLAEECGLIGEVGAGVLRRACLDRRGWDGLRVSVNLSPVQLRRRGFLERVDALLEAYGANAADFEVEITEGCLLQDDVLTQDTLAALRRRGFRLALDDFGTGYSSLSYLHRYPVQSLKLDRSFVARLPAAADARAVVRAVIEMARALELRVVAEGVETPEQFAVLRDMGCHAFQGFLFARPESADALAARLEAARAAG